MSSSLCIPTSDFGSLVEHVKDGSRTSVQQSQSQVHGIQSQMMSQAQAALRLQQQVCSPPNITFVICQVLVLIFVITIS